MSAEIESPKFSDFLESSPPNQTVAITDLMKMKLFRGQKYSCLTTPEIQLHCSHENCNGVRFFRCISGHDIYLEDGEDKNAFLIYLCSNCQSHMKEFAVKASRDLEGNSGSIYKFGENPVYGPPVPTKVLKLVGADRELFLKGRRCENQGLGVGAFVYYRRVVENQKNKILKEVRKVLAQLPVASSKIEIIDKAIAETQFSKAIAIAGPAIPESLYIGGHNPLTLLYRALSEGIHNQTDEQCLDVATSARVILFELSERLSQALKDEAELSHALNRLLSKID